MTYYTQTAQGARRINEWAYKAAINDGARVIHSLKHMTLIQERTK